MKRILFLFFIFSVCVFLSPRLSSEASAASILDGWSGELFAGYDNSSGNTDKGSINLDGNFIKKFDISEYQIKGSVLYSQTNKKMDGQKWDLLNKYFFDFGADLRYFNFYQVLVDHDRFADIDYRITPSMGLGYHLARGEDWTWDIDIGIGYRITRNRVNTASDDEVFTALAHTFLKKKVFSNAFLSQDLTVYPGLEADAGLTATSETAFTNPISERLDLQFQYVVDYNSRPAADKSTTDKQLIAGVRYHF